MTTPLRFEHIGPEDASGPPFVIAIGAPEASTDTRWFVTDACYRYILALIARHGRTRHAPDEPVGTFAVSAAGQAAVLLPPAAMKTVLQAVHRMYAEAKIRPPAMLVIHENLLISHSGP